MQIPSSAMRTGYGESEELYLGNYTVQQQTAPNYYTTMQEDLNVEVEKKNGEDPAAATSVCYGWEP